MRAKKPKDHLPQSKLICCIPDKEAHFVDYRTLKVAEEKTIKKGKNKGCNFSSTTTMAETRVR